MVATTGKVRRPISGPRMLDAKFSTNSNSISTNACNRPGMTLGLRAPPMKNTSITMLVSHADNMVLVTANCIRPRP